MALRQTDNVASSVPGKAVGRVRQTGGVRWGPVPGGKSEVVSLTANTKKGSKTLDRSGSGGAISSGRDRVCGDLASSKGTVC